MKSDNYILNMGWICDEKVGGMEMDVSKNENLDIHILISKGAKHLQQDCCVFQRRDFWLC